MTHILNYIKKNKLLWPLLLIGFIVHMLIIMPSGTEFCYLGKCGIYFFGVHGFDMIWHLALSEVSFNSVPFVMPIFSGAGLGGYNYLMDLVVSIFMKVGIPSLLMYFKILPIIWFIFFTFSAIRFGLRLNKSPLFIGILLFLLYFCGSLAYIISIWHTGTIVGSAGLVAMQSIHSLANMQFALSLILVLELLIVVKNDRIDKKSTFLIALYIFLAMGLKFYAGIVLLFLAGVFVLFKLFPIDKKKTPKVIASGFLILLSSVISIVVFYNPLASSQTGAIFTFQPLATVHPIIEASELFYLPQFVSARYSLQGHIGPRLIAIETLTIFIFLFFNYGVRLLGILFILAKSAQRKAQKWEVIVLLSIIFATLLNMLLVQKGEWWNTVQFLYYGIFMSTIFTAQFIYSLVQRKKILLTTIAALLIISTLPITFDLLNAYIHPESAAYLPKKEMDALAFLKKQPKGVVFQPLYNEDVTKQQSSPRPLFANYDNPYIAAFSGKQVYYTNLTQIRLTGIDYKQRLDRIKANDCTIIDEVQYAYVVKQYEDTFVTKCINGKLHKIFDNDAAKIFKVK